MANSSPGRDMMAAEDRNHIVGCLALLAVAVGLYYLASNTSGRERGDREIAIREECIRTGRAAIQARNPAARMTREQEGDLVVRCLNEARRNSN
jgi:hypothetical protein